MDADDAILAKPSLHIYIPSCLDVGAFRDEILFTP